MTEARRQELEEKLNDAEAHGDEAAIMAIRKTMDQEYRLCTAHTAERMKRIEKTVNEIKAGLIPDGMFQTMQTDLSSLAGVVGQIQAEIRAWKNQAKGAKLLWTVLSYLAAAGGSGILVNLLTSAK